MKTRTQYLKNECTHSEYYADFVTPSVWAVINSRFTNLELSEALKADEHFNSIPLHVWDGMGQSLCSIPLGLSNIAKEKGDVLTKSGLVCILKEAARQLAQIV